MKPSQIIKACHTDMPPEKSDKQKDCTEDPYWILEQVDRLLAWEIMQRYFRHQCTEELLPQELCDKIGVHKGFVYEIIKSVQKKINA